MGKPTKPVPPPTSFRFGEEVRAALRVIADRESRSVSNAIEWLAKDYFKQNQLDWPTASEKPSSDGAEKSK